VCVWKDNLVPVFEKLLESDVLVLAGPVYYYGLTAQLKTFIDRTYAWHSRVKNKKLYFITSSQAPYDEKFKAKLQYVIDSVIGYADCFWGEMTYEQTIGGWDIDNYPDITKYPAYNINKPMHREKSGWLGYVITIDGVRLYDAGDCDAIPEGESVNADIRAVTKLSF
jgi:multimeric flavodoxin WrbA